MSSKILWTLLKLFIAFYNIPPQNLYLNLHFSTQTLTFSKPHSVWFTSTTVDITVALTVTRDDTFCITVSFTQQSFNKVFTSSPLATFVICLESSCNWNWFWFKNTNGLKILLKVLWSIQPDCFLSMVIYLQLIVNSLVIFSFGWLVDLKVTMHYLYFIVNS